jgi:hypothetical protein
MQMPSKVVTNELLLRMLTQFSSLEHYSFPWLDFNEYVSPSGSEYEGKIWYGWRLSINIEKDTYYSNFVESHPDTGQEPVEFKALPLKYQDKAYRDLAKFESIVRDLGFVTTESAIIAQREKLTADITEGIHNAARAIEVAMRCGNQESVVRLRDQILVRIDEWLKMEPFIPHESDPEIPLF